MFLNIHNYNALFLIFFILNKINVKIEYYIIIY